MKVRTLITLLATAVVLFLMVGCADLPQAEIDEAQAALDAAKNAEADRYVPDMYNSAKKALDDAMALVKEEESAMFSSYDEAITMLQGAKEAANGAANAVAGKKAEVQGEVESMLQQIPEQVAQTRTAWRKAPRGKGTREPLQMMKDEISATEASVADVNAALDSGDLLGARQKAQAIMNKLRSLQSELTK